MSKNKCKQISGKTCEFRTDICKIPTSSSGAICVSHSLSEEWASSVQIGTMHFCRLESAACKLEAPAGELS